MKKFKRYLGVPEFVQNDLMKCIFLGTYGKVVFVLQHILSYGCDFVQIRMFYVVNLNKDRMSV